MFTLLCASLTVITISIHDAEGKSPLLLCKDQPALQTLLEKEEFTRCWNNGTCMYKKDKGITDITRDLQKAFKKGWVSCKCLKWYKGQLCKDVNCKPNPCHNGATCKPDFVAGKGVAVLKCECGDEFTGKFCETKFKEQSGASKYKCKLGKSLAKGATCIHGKCRKANDVTKKLRKFEKSNVTKSLASKILTSIEQLIVRGKQDRDKLKLCDCTAGYSDIYCSRACPTHFWGVYCLDPCGRCKSNKTCHHNTGKCQECAGSYKSPFCVISLDDVASPEPEPSSETNTENKTLVTVMVVEGQMQTQSFSVSRLPTTTISDTGLLETTFEGDVAETLFTTNTLGGAKLVSKEVYMDRDELIKQLEKISKQTRVRRKLMRPRQADAADGGDGAGDITLGVKFELGFAPSAATASGDFESKVTDAIIERSQNFESSLIPGLRMDDESIQVNAVGLRSAEEPKSVSAATLAAAVVGGVCFVAISVMAIIVIRRKSRKALPIKGKPARTPSKRSRRMSQISNKKSTASNTGKSIKGSVNQKFVA